MRGGSHLKITGAQIWAANWHLLLFCAGAIVLPEAALAWPKEVGPPTYVGSNVSGGVSVIDTKTNIITAAISIDHPTGLAVSPDGRRVYVADGPIIDTRTNTIIGGLNLSGQNIAITPDGSRGYITHSGGDVYVFDLKTNKQIAWMPVGYSTYGVAVAPNGKNVYVTIQGGDPPSPVNIAVVDSVTNKVTANIETGGKTAYFVAIAPDSETLYVTDQNFPNLGDVAVINAKTNKVTARIGVGFDPTGIVVTPDGKKVYVSNYGSVTVINAVSNTVVATIPVTGDSQAAVMSPDGKRVYVTQWGAGKVSVIDTIADKVAAVIPLGKDVYGIAIVPPPLGLPFNTIKIAGLSIDRSGGPKHGSFNTYAYVTLGAGGNGIHPDVEPVTLMLDGYSTTIPPGSFQKLADGSYSLFKWVNGSLYNASIKPQGGALYLVHLSQTFLTLPDFANPVQVRLIVGDDAGLVSVNATLPQPPGVQALK